MQMIVRMTENGPEFGKTKLTNPYDFDPITHFQADNIPDDARVTSAWSDRLPSQYPDRYEAVATAHFGVGATGDFWDRRSPESIEAFLRDLLDCPDLVLVAVVETCNVSTGYSVWQFKILAQG